MQTNLLDGFYTFEGVNTLQSIILEIKFVYILDTSETMYLLQFVVLEKELVDSGDTAEAIDIL